MSSQTLLLVDDEVSVLNALKRVLRKEKYNIITASNGNEALQILMTHPQEVAVIISDFRMPLMTGDELLREISVHYPQMVRMILSGYADRDNIIDFINSGHIFKFLSKPWDDEVLRRQVEQAFQHAERQNHRVDIEVLFDQQNTGICVTDDQHVILKANDFAKKLMGLSDQELIGRHIFDERSPLFYPYNLQSAIEDSLKAVDEWHGEGSIITFDESCIAISLYVRRFFRKDHRTPRYFYQIIDISKQKKLEADIQYRLNYNEITGLFNRHYLIENLPKILADIAARRKPLALAIVEIDRFSNIYNGLGNHIADKFLHAIGTWMNDWCESKGILIFHLNSNKFAFVFPNMINFSFLEQRIQEFHYALKTPFMNRDQKIYVTVSMGVSIFPHHGNTVDTLMTNAKLALLQAQSRGEKTCFYKNICEENTQDIPTVLLSRISLESDLFEAVSLKQFELYYQPFVDIETGKPISCEALLRWQHPKRGMVYPKDFIPILEETGLIGELGEWIIFEACKHLKEIHQLGFPDLRVSINLSARQIQNSSFNSYLVRTLEHLHLAPSSIELEMTESMLMANFTACRVVLEDLRRSGVNLALDDFGTGYSSFSVLKDLPFNILKIDQSFIQEINYAHNTASIVSSIIAMGQSLGMKIVAEGVETVDQLEKLRKYKCDFAQGYYFSVPLPKDKLLEFLAINK